jgi:hypothetical protein
LRHVLRDDGDAPLQQLANIGVESTRCSAHFGRLRDDIARSASLQNSNSYDR